jgi:hypothetical protein
MAIVFSFSEQNDLANGAALGAELVSGFLDLSGITYAGGESIGFTLAGSINANLDRFSMKLILIGMPCPWACSWFRLDLFWRTLPLHSVLAA